MCTLSESQILDSEHSVTKASELVRSKFRSRSDRNQLAGTKITVVLKTYHLLLAQTSLYTLRYTGKQLNSYFRLSIVNSYTLTNLIVPILKGEITELAGLYSYTFSIKDPKDH